MVIVGPGHGGNAFISNAYLDGTYSRGIKWLLQNYINKIPKLKGSPNSKGLNTDLRQY